MANEGKQIPALYPIACVIGDDWGISVTFADAIDTDTFVAKIQRDNTDVLTITCMPNIATKTVALSLTDIQTATLNGIYNYYFERTRSGYTLTLMADTFEAIVKK